MLLYFFGHFISFFYCSPPPLETPQEGGAAQNRDLALAAISAPLLGCKPSRGFWICARAELHAQGASYARSRPRAGPQSPRDLPVRSRFEIMATLRVRGNTLRHLLLWTRLAELCNAKRPSTQPCTDRVKIKHPSQTCHARARKTGPTTVKKSPERS